MSWRKSCEALRKSGTGGSRVIKDSGEAVPGWSPYPPVPVSSRKSSRRAQRVRAVLQVGADVADDARLLVGHAHQPGRPPPEVMDRAPQVQSPPANRTPLCTRAATVPMSVALRLVRGELADVGERGTRPLAAATAAALRALPNIWDPQAAGSLGSVSAPTHRTTTPRRPMTAGFVGGVTPE